MNYDISIFGKFYFFRIKGSPFGIVNFQNADLTKWMSDSYSATPKTHKYIFLRNFVSLEKQEFLGPQFRKIAFSLFRNMNSYCTMYVVWLLWRACFILSEYFLINTTATEVGRNRSICSYWCGDSAQTPSMLSAIWSKIFHLMRNQQRWLDR